MLKTNKIARTIHQQKRASLLVVYCNVTVTWHISEAIRASAERLIAKLASNARLASHWPTKTEMTLPINGETLRVMRKEHRQPLYQKTHACGSDKPISHSRRIS
jgi:hypothetical protein